jgi:hypothetical protein
MTLRLESIVDADGVPGNPEPTTVLSEITAPRHRRDFLKMVVNAGLAVGVAALSAPFLGKAMPAFAESGPGGLSGHDGCGGIDYTPQSDTHGMYVSAKPACYGGSYRGWNWCSSSGWHESTWRRSANNQWCWHMSPRSDVCGSPARNAWRWTTSDGKTWRCSDGNSLVFRMSDGKCFGPYLSICRAKV